MTACTKCELLYTPSMSVGRPRCSLNVLAANKTQTHSVAWKKNVKKKEMRNYDNNIPFALKAKQEASAKSGLIFIQI